MLIKLENLPKISLNQWYSGCHWTKRKKIKDEYKLIINSQFDKLIPKSESYKVRYDFHFSKRPLDCSNAVAMVKLIEDVIFEDDNYKIVSEITISSKKSSKDYVVIEWINK